MRKASGINDTHEYSWWIPLTFIDKNDLANKLLDWISSNQREKTITAPNEIDRSSWILFNVDQMSEIFVEQQCSFVSKLYSQITHHKYADYYRVAYDEENYGLLINQLMTNHTAISIRNRGQILDDSFNLAVANLIPYKLALSISNYLEHETEYVPWRSVLTEIDYIDIMFYGSQDFGIWQVNDI